MGAPLHIELANLGMADTLILMVLALVVFGPRRLPQIGRQIGKLMYEFRKASNDFKFQMEEELRLSEEADRRKKEEEEERQRAAAVPAPILPPAETPSQTPTPSIEAQADIGAVEPVTASPSAREISSVEGFPAEVAERIAEPVSTIPRLQPPQTGEQVAASRQGLGNPNVDGGLSPAAKNGGSPESDNRDVREPNQPEPDLAVSVSEHAPASNPDAETPIPPKEHVSQHG
jgi:sec-independent protein translocase protein TatB